MHYLPDFYFVNFSHKFHKFYLCVSFSAHEPHGKMHADSCVYDFAIV